MPAVPRSHTQDEGLATDSGRLRVTHVFDDREPRQWRPLFWLFAIAARSRFSLQRISDRGATEVVAAVAGQ